MNEAVNEYKTKYNATRLKFEIVPGACFLGKKEDGVSIVHKVWVNSGWQMLKDLIGMIKNKLAKYKVTFSNVKFVPHITLTKVRSNDKNVIDLIKNDTDVLGHLKSVSVPKEIEKGFDLKSDISLYNGDIKLASYNL